MDARGCDLDFGIVLETLQLAVCQNPAYLKSSEEKLKEWEKVPGFNSLLQSICNNYQIDLNIRLLAVLCCKNGIDKYWRKTAPNALSEDEKASLRRGFLSDFREPIPHLAKQKAVLIAKVARYDCPHDWPELMPTLLKTVESEDPLVQSRCILVLRQVVKNLSSKRLPGDKKMFQQLADDIFFFIYSFWSSHTEAFFMKYKTEYEGARNSLESALLALRILDKLTVYGFKNPEKNGHVVRFILAILDGLKSTTQIRNDVLRGRDIALLLPYERELVETLEKFICKQFSILLNLLENHPYAFVNFIRGSLELSVFFAFSEEGHAFLFERLLIQCFNMIKAIILCTELKVVKYLENCLFVDPNVICASSTKKEFFTDGMVSDICRKLITHYFLLTPAELELWESDPESFATDDAGESWKYSLRPCIETLFVTVFHEFRTILAPILVDLIKSNAPIVPPENFDAILVKDAVYNAIGLGAFDMYDEVNFNDWFMTTLREELSLPGNNYRIIRRRVAWLLSRWTGIKLSSQLYPALYSAMIPLLGAQEDLVVRLQAAQTIKTVVDNFEFNPETFLEYLEPLFSALFELLKEVQECDTKMRVLSVLYFIVERVGNSIEPYYEDLLKYLPLLWNESENHNMLRCAVVGTLVHLVKALGHIKVPMNIHDFILSIISFSTDKSHDSGFYLLEDGLELWLVVMENISQPEPDIMQLFHKMPILLSNNTEYIGTSLHIMQAYVLLAPEEFLRTHGEAMFKCCCELYQDKEPNHEDSFAIIELFELCIKAHAQLAIPLLKPFLQNVFEFIYRGYSVDGIWNRVSFITCKFSLLSRVMLSSKETFIEIVSKICLSEGLSVDEVVSKLLDTWFKHMPLISQLDRKKLNALALASLLTANSNFVYDKFCGILLAVVEVLNDLTMVDFQGEIIDSLVYTLDSDLSDSDCYETEHEIRKKKLAVTDPVHSVVLEKYFRYQLSELESTVGPEKFKHFVDTVDVETLDMVCLYVNIRVSSKEGVAAPAGTSSELITLFRTQLGI